MRFSNASEIDRSKFERNASEYVKRDTYSDKVLVNKGTRPNRGKLLAAFEAQLAAASDYIGEKLAKVSL